MKCVFTLTVSRVICALMAFVSANSVLAQTNCAPIPAGLVSWWRAEGNAFDSENNNNGNFSGANYAAGEVGLAFNFDGSGNNVRVPASPLIDVGSGVGMTIEAWIYSTDSSTGRPIFEWVPKEVGAYGAHFYAHIPSPGVLYANLYDTAGNHHMIETSAGLVQTNMYQHVAVTYDKASGVARLFVNGQVATQSVLGTFTPQTSPDLSIGYRPNTVPFGPIPFFGRIDEVSLYSRALAPAEVQAIYNAGSAGKCFVPTPPVIVAQPTNQSVIQGSSASFSVLAAGSGPLGYQWLLGGVSLSGATASTLTLTNAQFAEAGVYSVVVSNSVGTVTSSNATLIVNKPPPCQLPPAGLVSWWKGDGDANDSVGGNNGVFNNTPTFVPGVVGQAFSFNGINQYVEIPDAPSLNPTTNFSLETWVYVKGNPNTDLATIITKFSPVDWQQNQYQLETHYSGGRLNFRALLLLPSGSGYVYGYVDGSTTIQFNTWYHVAMTYDNSVLKLYVNGALDGSVAASGAVAPTTQPLRIGGPSSGPWWFNGLVDEVSLYSRALLSEEVQAIYNAGASGKCVGTVAPSIITQPQNASSTVGGSAAFRVVAAGSVPLSYQWLSNGTPIQDATNSFLSISNLTLSSASSYSVVITNVAGSITSSPALLTVTLPPAAVQVGAAVVAPDGTVTVPVNLVANGNENGVGFTLNFNPTVLTNTGIVLGSAGSGASLFPNLIHASAGQIGVAVALPAGNTFSAGIQQLVVVSFNSPIVSSSNSTIISFGDAVVQRVLADVAGNPLPATFTAGTIILPPSQLEGDSFPRPNGDGLLTVSDWVLIGRYVARLDSPTNALEFQKADCAPRETLGDGALTISDWVQAGRYVAGLDPAARVGGPTNETPTALAVTAAPAVTRKTVSNARQVRLNTPLFVQGQTGTIAVSLDSLGDENALSFSLNFDATRLAFVNASVVDAASNAILNINAKQAAQGHLGFVLALPSNQSFAAGSSQLIQASFRALPLTSGAAAIAFADQPVPRGVSDPNAVALAADYINAAIPVSARPSLKIVAGSNSFNLSWPTSPGGFVLQDSTDLKFTPTSWTTVTTTPVTSNGDNLVSLSASPTNKFYRLYHP